MVESTHKFNGKVVDISLSNMAWWALIHAMTAYEKAHGAKIVDEIAKRRDHQIVFKIDGIELDFMELMERLDEGTDSWVKKEAVKLLKERLSEFDSTLYKMRRELIHKAKEKLGLELEEDD